MCVIFRLSSAMALDANHMVLVHLPCRLKPQQPDSERFKIMMRKLTAMTLNLAMVTGLYLLSCGGNAFAQDGGLTSQPASIDFQSSEALDSSESLYDYDHTCSTACSASHRSCQDRCSSREGNSRSTCIDGCVANYHSCMTCCKI